MPNGDRGNKGFWAFLVSDNFWTFIFRVFGLLLMLMATLFVGVLVFGKGGTDLDKVELTRGLITVLLVVATVVLVVIVVLSTVSSSSLDENVAKRVQIAKDVMTPLFAILGTVIGFYFGSHSTGDTAPQSTGTQNQGKQNPGNQNKPEIKDEKKAE